LTRFARQIATGLVYAVVSVLLVIGSLSLALAQQHAPSPARITNTSPSTESAAVTPTSESTTFETSVPVTQPPSTSPAIFYPTLQPLGQFTAAPPQACGPYLGWFRDYRVRPGDTLFHIATSYHTTVVQLQRANCKTGSVIFPGELLWVPYRRMMPPGLTTIPNFDTPTDWPTDSPTATDSAATATASALPTESSTAVP
jgi:hypothetical protein